MEGVKQRLIYWGFDENGNTTVEVKSTVGGYEFRGDLFTDESVPSKWNTLKAKLTNKQAVQDVIEEVAYTWFNRIMAIKILEKRGYLQPTLEYVTDLKTPHLVQEAKRGQHQLKQQKYVDLLQEYLLEDKEEQALGLLLSRLCNNNILLHDVFGRIHDYTEILLPNNLLARNGIIDLINSDEVEDEQYQEVELIGWLYQFYISDKKDEVFKGFKANKKARPEDIPAATQIFTPKWIVKYMVENTVGKIYLDYDTTSSLKPEMKYLVENDTVIPSGVEGQAESRGLIHNLEQLTLIDPAAGSGHILVTGFELLFKMYREQGYTAKNAVLSILQNNLFGLDIDDRAMQLSRFAVLLKAAEFYPEILKENTNNTVVLPHIYSFPESHDFQLDELQSFLTAQGSSYVNELRTALQLLNEGKNIGAALKLELTADAYFFITKQYQDWQNQIQAGTLDIMQAGLWENLQPFLAVLLVMSKKYTAVVANPPYMGKRSMNDPLKDYLNEFYPDSKIDLMTVFMEVCPFLATHNGLIGMINLPSWMFISSFEELRKKLLKSFSFESLLENGRGIFGSDFGSVAFILSKNISKNSVGKYKRLFDPNDKGKVESVSTKEKRFFKSKQTFIHKKDNFFKIPGTPIAYWVSERIIEVFKEKNLNDNATLFQGIITGDNKKFLRDWHEVSLMNLGLKYSDINETDLENKYWVPYNKGGDSRKWYGNQEYVVNFHKSGRDFTRGKHQFSEYFFKPCFSWTYLSISSLDTRYFPEGFIWDVSGSSAFPHDSEDINYFIPLIASKVGYLLLNIINPTINFQVENLCLLPIIYPEKLIKDKVIYHTDENIISSKKDWDSRETSWDFATSSLLNESASLKAAYQKWQDNVTQEFLQLHANEEELNRIFIDIYGLQEELTAEVALKDITILQDELDRNQLEQLEPLLREQRANAVVLPIKKDEVISQFLSYCIGLFMGRYRLNKPGLHIAHPNPTEEEIAPYVIARKEAIPSTKEFTFSIDEDAIVPLMSSECAFPDDALVRIKNLIHDLWGEDTLTENSNFINECLGSDLDRWLTDKFWGYHTSMYKKKPIYWMFSSNPKKPQQAAFKVLVYMHRMDKYTVSKIQRNYLHPHQEWIKKEIENLVANEVNLSKIELKRLEKLRSWDIECRDYNEVLKSLALQEITFDLDDGVSINYEKFEGAVAKI
jgi:hypothetical protein